MTNKNFSQGAEAEAGAGEDFLGRLVAASGVEEPSDLDVARLRRGVRARVARERRLAPRRLVAFAAAAALAVAAVGPVLVGGRQAGDRPAVAEFSRTDDGQVRIRFEDGRPVHRVRKQILTASGRHEAEETVKTVRGREFVDRNGQPLPGTIVMYVID